MQNNKPITVVYAEDHLLIREIITNHFSAIADIDFVYNCSNGKELIDYLTKSETQPDVVLLDIFMPEMGGIEAIKIIKQKWDSIKLLGLSSLSSNAFIVQLIESGIDSFLSKSCQVADIEQGIRNLYHYGIYYSEWFSRQLVIDVSRGKSNIPKINKTELEFLNLIVSDMSYTDIADKMCKSYKTIDGYSRTLYGKFGVHSRAGLMVCALQYGLVDLNTTL